MINERVLEEFSSASDEGMEIHDRDIEEWGLVAAEQLNLPSFVAGYYWITHFKRRNKIVSRKATAVVGRKRRLDAAELKNSIDEFMADVKPIIAKLPREKVKIAHDIFKGIQSRLYIGTTSEPGRTDQSDSQAVYQSQVHGVHSLSVVQGRLLRRASLCLPNSQSVLSEGLSCQLPMQLWGTLLHPLRFLYRVSLLPARDYRWEEGISQHPPLRSQAFRIKLLKLTLSEGEKCGNCLFLDSWVK